MSDISATHGCIHTKFYFCRDNVCRRASSPCGVHRPLGAGEGELKTQKMGGGLISAADSYHFCYSQRCQMWFSMSSTELRTFWYRTVKIDQGVSTGSAKSLTKFRIFHHLETLRPYISQTVKIEAYQQHTEKSFIPPLSNCRICMDPSLTGFYRVGQKLSDVIPVLLITPIEH